MNIYRVDLKGINTVEQLHERLAEELRLPDHYGRNLDALYDCLTEMEGEIFILGSEEADEDMQEYLDRLRAVSLDAQSDNPLLRIAFS